MTCASNQICVAYRTVGGGQILPDQDGNCPTSSHVESGHCAADYAYKCNDLNGCFGNAPVNCECASQSIGDTEGSCPTGYSSCSNPTADNPFLDPQAQLICQQLAP